ncbi:hypothetical protein [Mucilaginibacter lacusdianchii]|uniref:HU domain-containing protein n=1 Tax=Mucilaginibacter lacusdianchii TaxID=2684211 RepID=UPI00131CAACB|nr:hypothetical protein [Mucilaginibacter sp. JXJ CY 39]
MDLAVYISELLKEQGAVVLPGLGTFKQARVPGYYNEPEGKFYPPHYQAGFEANTQSDDLALALYLSKRNNISPASARFFVNKYVADLQQQLQSQEVSVDQLGSLHKQGNEIKFKPSTNAAVASAAYGFSAVNLRPEPVQPPAAKPEPPVTTPPLTTPPVQVPIAAPPVPPAKPIQPEPKVTDVPTSKPDVSTPAPIQPQPTVKTPVPAPSTAKKEHRPESARPEQAVAKAAHYVNEGTEEPKAQSPLLNIGRGIVITLILLVLAVGGIAIYRNMPAERGNDTASQQPVDSAANISATAADTVVINKTPAVTDTPAANDTTSAIDSAQQQAQTVPPATPAQATAAKTIVDADGQGFEYALLGGACSNVETATKIISRYKAQGVTATVLKNPPADKYFKICFGFFKTFPDGQNAKLRLVDKYHLERSKLYVEKIRQNPKK